MISLVGLQETGQASAWGQSQDSKFTGGLLWWWVACQDNFLAACSWRPVENLHVVYLGFLVLQVQGAEMRIIQALRMDKLKTSQ